MSTVERQVTTWVCNQLADVAMLHLTGRRIRYGKRTCTICRTSWPCTTFSIATAEPPHEVYVVSGGH